MARIENIQQLRAEIERVERVCKQHEENLKADLQQIREDFNPLNILLKIISSIAGIKLDKNDFIKDGIGLGISVFFQRLIMKAEKKVEHTIYNVIDSAVEKLNKFFTKFVDPSERRKARMDEDGETMCRFADM